MNNFDDYPSRKIGGGNPYYCCSLCGRSAPEVFGNLGKHNGWCAYRRTKEAIASDNKDDMFELIVEMAERDDCSKLREELGVACGMINGGSYGNA